MVPLMMKPQIESFGWLMVFFLQAIFVLRGLPCLQPGQHYVNCILLKIKFSFCLLCLVLTLSIFSFVTTYHLKNIVLLLVPFTLFIILKRKYHPSSVHDSNFILTILPIVVI